VTQTALTRRGGRPPGQPAPPGWEGSVIHAVLLLPMSPGA
jgi:hypothetical protein